MGSLDFRKHKNHSVKYPLKSEIIIIHFYGIELIITFDCFIFNIFTIKSQF